ncbi:hypothetical protein ACFL6C_03565 [Myxococcota bacterium]
MSDSLVPHPNLLLGCIVVMTSCNRDTFTPLEVDPSIFPPRLNFGDTWVGSTRHDLVTLVNRGNGLLKLGEVSTSPAFEVGAGPREVAPSATLEIEVMFSPLASGPQDGVLSLEGNFPGPLLVDLSGVGIPLPDCDDDNPCTDDSFDVDAGRCRNLERTGSCEDGNACTEDSVCTAGVCKGVAIDCDDQDACTLDLCDPDSGCAHLDDSHACDDNNPCTHDACSGDGECTHVSVENGTSCGELVCGTVHICQMGECMPLQISATGDCPVEAIAAGFSHTCALLEDGRVKCWGADWGGQLGDGSGQDRGCEPDEMGANLQPVDLGAGRKAAAIAIGWAHGCARLDDDTVKCWGANRDGQLGLGDTEDRGDDPDEMGDNLPIVDLGTGHTALAIAANGDHTCAMLDDRTVKCWGGNGHGQLGQNDREIRGDGCVGSAWNVNDRDCTAAPPEMGDALPAVDLGGLTPVAITVGSYHSCALLSDGNLKCWGSNQYGELGLGDAENRGDDPGEMAGLSRVRLPPGRTTVAIYAGSGTTTALYEDGTFNWWGSGALRRLGDLYDNANWGDSPLEVDEQLPTVNLPPGIAVVEPSMGGAHNCLLLDDDSVRCVGKNFSGELGRGDSRLAQGDWEHPGVDLGADQKAIAVAPGYEHTCALLTTGVVKCWGSNRDCNLGIGTSASELGTDPGDMGDNLPFVDLGP